VTTLDPAHIDAVANDLDCGSSRLNRSNARGLLTSTDPDVHAALAASLPDDVMLAELVKRGTLTEDPWSVRCTCGAEFSGQPDVVAAWNREHDDSPNALHIVRWQAPRIRPWTRRLVTAWEVTP
jgi:hypothetical protein